MTTDHVARIARIRDTLDLARLRADRRRVGEHVRYPRLEGDRLIDATGIIESIECVTPNLPYPDRTLELVIVCDRADRSRDRLRVSTGYHGIAPLG